MDVPDDAPVVLVLHQDGRAELTVAATVEDAALADYLRQLAGFVEGGHHHEECADCAAAGRAHDHQHTDSPEG